MQPKLDASNDRTAIGVGFMMVVALLLFSGCGTSYQGYPGPARPESQVAIVKLDSQFFCLSAVDGKSLRDKLFTISLLPGEHDLWFRCLFFVDNRHYLYAKKMYPVHIRVNAGAKYIASAWIEPSGMPLLAGIFPGYMEDLKFLRIDIHQETDEERETGDEGVNLFTWAPQRYKASIGDPVAQANLGMLYLNADGKGSTQNFAKALLWLRKSADQGYDVAENCLGWMYQNGLGVTADREMAAKWYREAVKDGNKDANERLHQLGIQP